MKFDIKCATFIRLASICNFFEPETPQETRDEINTVRLEIIDGKILAIATNQRILAVEIIGQAPIGQTGVAHIVLDPAIITQCRAESFIDGTLTINTIPEIAMATANTSSGWSYHGNACYWFDEPLLDKWREWAPDETVKKSEGIMMWNLYQVQALIESSPTGKVIFPKHVDVMKPIVLRDRNSQNWVGIFMAKPYGEIQKVAAELPKWWRE